MRVLISGIFSGLLGVILAYLGMEFSSLEYWLLMIPSCATISLIVNNI